MDKKPVIITIDNVRVRRWDRQNVFIEKYENVYNPKEKEHEMKWRFIGYESTIKGALESISRKGLLVDEKAVSDLKTYAKEVDRSNDRILEEVWKSGLATSINNENA